MLGKLSRANRMIGFFLLLTLAILCILTAYGVVDVSDRPTGKYGLHITAQQLFEKPSTYVTLTEADSYVLEAISKLNQDVYVGNWESTNIDNLLIANNTNNIEFNNQYYHIGLLSADPPPSKHVETILLLIAGWIIWITAAIAYIIMIIKKKQTN